MLFLDGKTISRKKFIAVSGVAGTPALAMVSIGFAIVECDRDAPFSSIEVF